MSDDHDIEMEWKNDEIATLRARVASLEAVERAARELATWFPFPEHPREVAPTSQADLRREYVKRLTNLLDALAPRSERREGEPCPRCKGLRTVPSSVGVGPLNVPCPECACKRCGGEGIVWDHRNEMPCPACAPAAPRSERATSERSERREGEPAKSHTVCIGWTTIQRVAKEGAVWFEDAGVGLVAADDLFHADVWQAAPPAAPKEEAP